MSFCSITSWHSYSCRHTIQSDDVIQEHLPCAPEEFFPMLGMEQLDRCNLTPSVVYDVLAEAGLTITGGKEYYDYQDKLFYTSLCNACTSKVPELSIPERFNERDKTILQLVQHQALHMQHIRRIVGKHKYRLANMEAKVQDAEIVAQEAQSKTPWPTPDPEQLPIYNSVRSQSSRASRTFHPY